MYQTLWLEEGDSKRESERSRLEWVMKLEDLMLIAFVKMEGTGKLFSGIWC